MSERSLSKHPASVPNTSPVRRFAAPFVDAPGADIAANPYHQHLPRHPARALSSAAAVLLLVARARQRHPEGAGKVGFIPWRQAGCPPRVWSGGNHPTGSCRRPSRNARDGRRSSGSLGHLVARAAEHAGVRAHPSCAPAGAGASRALHLDDAVHDVFMARPVLLVPAGGTESDAVALTGRERPARSHAVSRVAQQPQAAT